MVLYAVLGGTCWIGSTERPVVSRWPSHWHQLFLWDAARRFIHLMKLLCSWKWSLEPKQIVMLPNETFLLLLSAVACDALSMLVWVVSMLICICAVLCSYLAGDTDCPLLYVFKCLFQDDALKRSYNQYAKLTLTPKGCIKLQTYNLIKKML